MLNVKEFAIVLLSVNAHRDTSEMRTHPVSQNVPRTPTVRQANLLASTTPAKIHAMASAELELTVNCAAVLLLFVPALKI